VAVSIEAAVASERPSDKDEEAGDSETSHHMNPPTIRNALVVIGLWTLSTLVAFLIKALFIPVNNRLTFTGDVGTVTMWLWEGYPDELVAALAAIALVWVLETGKALAWVGGLATLYLYGGVFNAWRLITHGWRVPPHTPDYIGILTQAVIPTLACLAVGVWWTRHSIVSRQPNF
jgi:hypothetical protein